MQNVFHSTLGYAGVGQELIEKLKDLALKSPLRRSRFCLHRTDDDLLHEMVIALSKDCTFRPHKHEAKSESYHMIEGHMVFIMFSDSGVPTQAILLAPHRQNGVVSFRISDPIYHAVIPLDEVVVYQETTTGPFKKGEATVAPWAPEEPHALRTFLEGSAMKCGVTLKTQ